MLMRADISVINSCLIFENEIRLTTFNVIHHMKRSGSDIYRQCSSRSAYIESNQRAMLDADYKVMLHIFTKLKIL